MTSTFDHLYVLWRDLTNGTRHVVGSLWRDGQTRDFCFGYEPDLTLAHARGFLMLQEFQTLRESGDPYRSPRLFPTFARRIPSDERADHGATLDAWGVIDKTNPLEALARGGGVQLTDRLEFAEFRSADDSLSAPLEFRLAAEKHFANHGARVKVGNALDLRHEVDNKHDASATFVLADKNVPIGYVPRQYTMLIARLLDEGVPLAARAVRKLILPEESGRWVVEVRRS